MIACAAMGTFAVPMRTPRPSWRRNETTPPAASSPKSEPPESTTASRLWIVISGSSSVVSRLPGARPSVTPEATFGLSNMTAVTPLSTRSSCAFPTLKPGMSVIKLRGPGTTTLPTPRPMSPARFPRSPAALRSRSAWRSFHEWARREHAPSSSPQ